MKRSVAATLPAEVEHVHRVDVGQFTSQGPRGALVKQDAHLGGVGGLRDEERRARIEHHDGLGARDGGEILEKGID